MANVKSGFGTMTWEAERESYHGQWRDDRPHGEGTYLWQVLLPGTVEAARAQAAQAGRLSSVTAAASRGDLPLAQLAPHLHGINRYVGQFERGLRQGVGTFFYADGARYEGQWAANQKHGAGRFVYEDGSVYEGPFDRDRPVKPTQAGSAHGLVRLTCEDLLADEADPEGVRRALSNHLLREATELREIYRAAADPPSAQAVEWTLRPDVFGKLLRHAGALSPFLPLCAAPPTPPLHLPHTLARPPRPQPLPSITPLTQLASPTPLTHSLPTSPPQPLPRPRSRGDGRRRARL